MQTEFTVEYFIEKFEGIPEENFVIETHGSGEKRDALGHCGYSIFNPTEESRGLVKLIGFPCAINDGHHEYMYLGNTPKQRILNKLREIQKQQNS